VGTVENREVVEECLDKIFSMVSLDDSKRLSIVVDCGNGMEGAVIHKLLARIPMISAHVMYETPDGTFPNHEANPLKEKTLEALKHEVVSRGASVGLAFDGDGDRVGFVDELGNMIGGDVLTGLIGQELLRTHQGAKILFDLRSRRAVARAVEAAGGVPEMSRVGHAFIKKQMRENGAIFAGELSCHFYFQEYFSVECAEAAMLYVLKLLQTSGKPLSVLAAEFLSDAHSGEINFEVHDRAAALEKIELVYAPIAKSVSRLDGLLFDMGDWWFNVRPSNTEPLLRLNLEAKSADVMHQKISEVQNLIS
jgi:phosphomannomutase